MSSNITIGESKHDAAIVASARQNPFRRDYAREEIENEIADRRRQKVIGNVADAVKSGTNGIWYSILSKT